jgi:uroporphyrinogen-III synthase
VRAFARLDLRRELPVFCVGGRTAETATEAGFTNVSSADGDVGDLAALIKASLPKGAHVLHAGNEDAVGDLAGALEAAGLEASFVPLFRAAPMTEPGSILKRHLLGQPEIDAVLIHSARAASVLAQFLAAEPGASPVSVAAISAQACRPLEGLVNRIEIAGRPDEPSLLEALAHLLDRA